MLEFLQPFFGEKSLSFGQLQDAVKESDIKPVDLSNGDYVSKLKYETEINSKKKEVETLRETAEQRKSELSELKSLLEKAGTDEDGLKSTLNKITEFEQKAEKDKEDFDKKLEQTRKEAAVKVFASGIDFSSKTAKKGFINSYLATNPELNDNGEVANGDEYLKQYAQDDPGAFNKKDKEDNSLPYIVNREKPKPQPEKFSLTKAMQNANGKE